MGVLLLSSLGLARLVAAWRPRWQAAATVLACGLFLLEVFPAALPISAVARVPDRARRTGSSRSIRRRVRDPLVVLHLPIYYLQEAYATDEATYMVDSTWHWAQILNGFSGGEPLGFMERMQHARHAAGSAAVACCARLGVDVIAVHGAAARAGAPLLDFFSQQSWAAHRPAAERRVRGFADALNHWRVTTYERRARGNP